MSEEKVLKIADEEVIDDLSRIIDEMEQALLHVQRESEHGRWGKPGYDMTLDDLWETADAALRFLWDERKWGYL